MPDVHTHPNATRYRRGDPSGHYESFFQRANHPDRPLAFWIRYTIFSPRGRPDRAVGELWAAWFDGETGDHVAVKHEVPIAECELGERELFARIGGAELSPNRLEGRVTGDGGNVAWSLDMAGGEPPLLLLPARFYDAPLPKAKALVGAPLVRFDGTVEVGGATHEIERWVGSQNHNWGSKHTDHYAWGQVAGFDGAPDAFLEVATARIKVGPLWSPFMTPLVLTRGQSRIELNGLGRAVRNRGSFSFFHWEFSGGADGQRLQGRISAPRSAFVGLAYGNPPGGIKHCLNSKIASCELVVEDERRGTRETLRTESRAAFEILVDPCDHGVRIRA